MGNSQYAIFGPGDEVGTIEIGITRGATMEEVMVERDDLRLEVARKNVALNDAYEENDRLRARIAELEAELAEARA